MSRRRGVGPSQYPADGLFARLRRRWRWHAGGYGRLAQLLPSEGRIVDLGAGWGLFAHALAAGGEARRVLAVEADPRRVAALRASAAELPIAVLEDDPRTVSLPPTDAVALVDVLQHLDEEQQADVVHRALRALLPGGMILLRTPDATATFRMVWTRLREAMMPRKRLPGPRARAYRASEAWVELLEGYGLKARALPPSSLSPWADRVVVGTWT
ncbi:MAG: class I SAM-dependent methyltransferase [Planctomycetes bacterium]|nr:class I SAM-dependent methyltransferase [Planctomycetota bacterium]MCB9828958.1 class I SAM-dependent methyltransferase [Planctomycetota bacterium]MCB9901813.1 class I SAM-dependent methyltransferase [Planctomycetota bacterium]